MAAFSTFLRFLKWKMDGKWKMENGVIVTWGALWCGRIHFLGRRLGRSLKCRLGRWAGYADSPSGIHLPPHKPDRFTLGEIQEEALLS